MSAEDSTGPRKRSLPSALWQVWGGGKRPQKSKALPTMSMPCLRAQKQQTELPDDAMHTDTSGI